mmetsp:Transcript_11410/g.36440  ORF Transcript_11410/g.36440 Transcript_11410/m.36440 type:complete len:388 (-) Transcript_11410:84-1247(-)
MDSSGNVEMFTSVTGASKEVAAKYLQNSKGDIDMAIALYLSDQEEAGEAGPPGGAPAAQGGAAAASGGLATVDSIVDLVKSRGDEGPSGGSAGSGAGGKGAGKGGPEGTERSVFIVFFSDGFMVDEDFELPKPEPTPEQPAAPPPRRTGMMSLNDLKKDPKTRGPMPKLPKLKPLRSYDTPENKAFLADVKAGRVPTELQKRDEKGAPVSVSIAIDDVRPKSYEELAKVIKQMEAMQKQMEGDQGGSSSGSKPAGPTLFAGAGNTLSSGSSSAAPAAGGAARSGNGADPALVAIAAAGPPPEADESKPVANIQLRLSTGARVKARLNHDHTVADLWRIVAAQMGNDAFRAASNHQLVAGFPPKPLSDTSLTVAAADLANAAVTHRCQ